MSTLWSRRRALQHGAGLVAALSTGSLKAATDREIPRLATFSANVTVPVGHGMMGGSWKSRRVLDPLEAHGVILMQGSLRLVWVSVDWCEIRNDAYEAWQNTLARAVDTTPDRVMITTVHQHDAPVADLTAERILRQRGLSGSVCDPSFHAEALERVFVAARTSLRFARPVTHYGTGQARVQQVASNRRYTMPDGQIRFDRTSSTRNAFAIAGEEGLIDPMLKTLSFWEHDTALAALSFYAVHPMSYYGQGDVSADFPGLARRKRQSEVPGTRQIYCSGCSGNVTAGKYNNGAPENRSLLADRLHKAMSAAWANTKRRRLTHLEHRVEQLTLAPRSSTGFSEAELEAKLKPETAPFQQCLAAMGLSWRRRCDAGKPIQLPVVDLGGAQMLLLPGEAYVEYQLAAQKARPDSFVCVAGYGDGGTGYIPTQKHLDEKDPNLGDWCWVDPGAEAPLLKAIQNALKKTAGSASDTRSGG